MKYKVTLKGRTYEVEVNQGEAMLVDEYEAYAPGEYAEAKHFSVGLACFSFEADVVAIVQSADEPYNLFGASLHTFISRPLIGIITKKDSPNANVPMVRLWMENAGCDRIFEVNNKTREGIAELLEYLNDDLPSMSMEEAIERQRRGLSEWDDVKSDQ